MRASHWIGLIGHTNTLTHDGRMLSAAWDWTKLPTLGTPQLPLLFRAGGDPRKPAAGRLDHVVQINFDLYGTGVIWDGFDLTGLYPELDVVDVELQMEVQDDKTVMVITSGRIAAVTLGKTPAWPTVWIR